VVERQVVLARVGQLLPQVGDPLQVGVAVILALGVVVVVILALGVVVVVILALGVVLVLGTAGVQTLAAGSGRIAFAGRIAGRGVISIEHSPGVRTTYEPVRAVVVAGQFVRKGDRIGYLAPDRRHPDSLHWGLRIRDGYADPMRLLRARPMLKPRSRSEVPTSSAYLTHGGELDR